MATLRRPTFDVWITKVDLEAIRASLRSAPTCAIESETFFGADLERSFRAWDEFVDTDWSTWDPSEYRHEIWCRSLIQLAIEHSSNATIDRLLVEVDPIDTAFKQRMAPARVFTDRRGIPLQLDSYFWERNTLHPDLRHHSST